MNSNVLVELFLDQSNGVQRRLQDLLNYCWILDLAILSEQEHLRDDLRCFRVVINKWQKQAAAMVGANRNEAHTFLKS